MGQDQSGAGFRESDWRLLSRTPRHATWQNIRHPTQRIEEYQVHASGSPEVDWLKNMYYFRKNHRSIVAALYLSEQGGTGLCSDSKTYSIFLERIPIRLADIEHVPYPDYLHLFGQCLRGYAELAREVGFFVVEEEYIGVNEAGVIKVWLNEDTSKTHLVGGRVSEGIMVRSIIDAVSENSDSVMASHLPDLKNYLYRNTDSLTFALANQQFTQYVHQYTQGEPSRLECIDLVGGIDVIANRPRDQSSYSNSSINAPVPAPQSTHAHVPAPPVKPVPEPTLTRQHSDVMLSFPPRPPLPPDRGQPAQRISTPIMLSQSSSSKQLEPIRAQVPVRQSAPLQPPKPPTINNIPAQDKPKIIIGAGTTSPPAILPKFGNPNTIIPSASSHAPPAVPSPAVRAKGPSNVYFSPPHHKQQAQKVTPIHQVLSPQPPRHFSQHSTTQLHHAPPPPVAHVPKQRQNKHSVPSFLRKNSNERLKDHTKGAVNNSVSNDVKLQDRSVNGAKVSTPLQSSQHQHSKAGSIAQVKPQFSSQEAPATDLLVSFNPAVQHRVEETRGDGVPALGSKYKDFNIEQGKSSQEFMKQLQQMKAGSTEYSPIDYSRWRQGRNSSSQTASFMPGIYTSLGTEPEVYRNVGEVESQSLIGTYQGISEERGGEGGVMYQPPSFQQYPSQVPSLTINGLAGQRTVARAQDSSYSPHRKLAQDAQQ